MNKGKSRLRGKKTAQKKDAGPSKDKALKSPPESLLVKYDPLQRYLWEIGQHPLLTKEEEKELAIRVREHGDRDAAYKLVTSNLRLVVKIAMEFQRVWMQNLLDLIQEGNIGLMQAARKFDPHKGVRFSYYASFWIKAYILKFIMDNWRLVKIGTTQAQRKLFFRLKKEKQRLISEGFDPKPKLLSERLGVTEKEVTDMDQRLDGWELSLDAPIKEGSDDERSEFIATEEVSAETQVARKEMEAILHEKIATFKTSLNQREVDILEKRVLSDTPATLQEIGERYGVSRERVRQIENNMMKRMKSYFEREIPDFASFVEGLSQD
ncbi:MAG: RNA polymerase factor sigma-32 [Thermodesulfobacteriota bacterium]|nr:RNA polymerase factor sigma-32 [Thermodesulfobacteriota bacterium]